MAKAKKLTSPSPRENNDVQLQLMYGDEAQFRHWESHLFNDAYLRRDLSAQHSDRWNNTDDLTFQHFMTSLHDLVEEYRDRESEFESWSETETINNLVKHVLSALGWTDNCSGVQNPFLEETSFRSDGKTYRTDILIVDNPREKQYVNQAEGDKKIVEARSAVIMPVEVKYWQRLEEYRQGRKEERRRNDGGSDDIGRVTTPNEQTLQYMEILKKDWGILTDGARWRLFNRDISSEDSNRYFEFNFFSLFQSIATEANEIDRKANVEAAKYFYHFFSKPAFYPKDEGAESFVSEILRYSKKYVSRAEEDLKDRFVRAMNIACNGFWKSSKDKQPNVAVIRNVAESTLFNILFIKSLESRGVLPMSSTDYRKISLSNIIDKIEGFDPEKEDQLNIPKLDRAFRKGNGNSFVYSPEGDELHQRILTLMTAIHDGNKDKKFGFEIQGFRESVFSSEEWKFFKNTTLANHEWVRILFQLGYAESESLNRKYQQIPYSFFTPRQLGSIYESFLEFKLDQADKDMVYEKRAWKEADLSSRKYKGTDLPHVSKGELFFTPDNEDRKATGSYYTPDYVVKFMLARNLLPRLINAKSSDILKVKICDPAMGSGHFLVGALKFLTGCYLSALSRESTGDLKVSPSEARRAVLDACIFGVDVNPRAVKLAKMSLWLETADISKKLENLADQLKCGDSLEVVGRFSWKSAFEKVFERGGGFDFVFGNPPYARIQTLNNFGSENLVDYKGKFKSAQFGNYDYYVLFFEKGFELLNPDGVLSYITPLTYQMSEFGTGLRQFLIDSQSLAEVYDFRQHQVFKGVSTYSGITTLKKNCGGTFSLLKLKSHEVPAEQLAAFERNPASPEFISASEVSVPDHANKWSLGAQSSQGILEKMKSKFPTLGSYTTKIYQGVATSADKVFILDLIDETKSHYVCECGLDNSTVKIEKEICREFYFGRDISRYSKLGGKRVAIFPYVKGKSGKYELISPEVIRSKFPLAYRRLESHRDALEKREKGRYKGKMFYAYSRPQNLDDYDQPKMMMRNFSRRSQVALDSTGVAYFTTNIYGVNFKNSDKNFLLYMLSVMNSDLMWYFMKMTGAGLRGGYFQYKTKYVQPFPVPDFNSAMKQNSALVSKLIENTKSILKSGGDSSLEDENDTLVFKLYGLTREEISTVVEETAQDRIAVDEAVEESEDAA